MFIRLTRKFKKLTPEAKDRVKEFEKKFINLSAKEKSTETGLTAEWFKEQNLIPPDDIKEEEEDKIVFEIDKDTVDAKSDYLCNSNNVEDFESTEYGTMITYDTGKEVLVEEEIETILKMIRNG